MFKYEYIFFDVEDAEIKSEDWRADYNTVRPHSALGMKSPLQYKNEYFTNT